MARPTQQTSLELATGDRCDRAAFIDFIYELYAGNSNFKDSLLTVTKNFLHQRDRFSRECFVQPLVVRQNGRTQAQALAIHHPALPVLQLGFFEARPDDAAVSLLVTAAENLAQQRGLRRVLVGLNGHVSYGVGLLLGPHDKPISFDSQYSLDYYPAFFRTLDFSEKTLSTYFGDIDRFDLSGRGPERTQGAIQYRCMDLGHFAAEASLFGELCDAALAHTEYYFARGGHCMAELLKPLKPLLRPEHLIFALDGGREVGFIFWHPDYNQALPGGRRNSTARLLWSIWRQRRKIDRVKLNVIGMLPGYLSTGLGLGLLNQMYQYCHGRYRSCETNYVWDSNLESTRINQALSDGVLRRYAVYEREL